MLKKLLYGEEIVKDGTVKLEYTKGSLLWGAKYTQRQDMTVIICKFNLCAKSETNRRLKDGLLDRKAS